MFLYNSSPLEDIATDRLRSSLSRVLDDVRFYEQRYAILRRGRPVAGLVPITEARALFEASQRNRKFRDIALRQKIEEEDMLRNAIRDCGEAALADPEV
ncbi:type II toxin-antitoxin system Phd/YefM family antitoxin [Marivita hallyeonensis]|uniref:Antitoxin Phd_YefM, type II toxin-antitoxin system n=1 Tax=Marivita hallyeonensis TaxID=996342 RepID=A0A1M5M1Z5_9RHOB|nr:type II toxin-antitoxin system Phd/YefM family antitoxin [Marivita hallyeonensis]SHG70929.1 Antitoxin Phd_YefM, type II toxin-antitoxin system [Marivita hallyeonensis]